MDNELLDTDELDGTVPGWFLFISAIGENDATNEEEFDYRFYRVLRSALEELLEWVPTEDWSEHVHRFNDMIRNNSVVGYSFQDEDRNVYVEPIIFVEDEDD